MVSKNVEIDECVVWVLLCVNFARAENVATCLYSIHDTLYGFVEDAARGYCNWLIRDV